MVFRRIIQILFSFFQLLQSLVKLGLHGTIHLKEWLFRVFLAQNIFFFHHRAPYVIIIRNGIWSNITDNGGRILRGLWRCSAAGAGYGRSSLRLRRLHQSQTERKQLQTSFRKLAAAATGASRCSCCCRKLLACLWPWKGGSSGGKEGGRKNAASQVKWKEKKGRRRRRSRRSLS